MRYRLLAAARVEYLATVRWYHEQDESGALARDFMAEFRARMERAGEQPGSGARITGLDCVTPVRRIRLLRFPYHVMYALKEQEQELVVLAIFHKRRAPGYWTDRLDPFE